MTDVAEPGRCDQEPDLAPTGATAARSRKGAGGPRTAEGKARSARNALKHGLRAETHLPEELAAHAEARAARIAADLKPRTEYQLWLVRRAGLAAAKLDRLEELDAENLRDRIERAETCWGVDKSRAVEELAARLGKDPARVAAALRATRHGVAWLIARWEGLGAVLARRGAWDDAQRRLALDLLGTPPELREGSPIAHEESTRDDLSRIVARTLAALRRDLAERLATLDARERRRARRGLFLVDDPTTRNLRRYEAASLRDLNRSLREFRRAAPPARPPSASPHAWATAGGPASAPAPNAWATAGGPASASAPNAWGFAGPPGGARRVDDPPAPPPTAAGTPVEPARPDAGPTPPPGVVDVDVDPTLAARCAELERRDALTRDVRAAFLADAAAASGTAAPASPPPLNRRARRHLARQQAHSAARR